IGDLIATPALAHVGFAEAIVAVQDLLGESPLPVDYARVPWCIYCSPEVAFAGYSEQAARDAGYDVVTHTSHYSHNAPAMIVARAGARRAHGRAVGHRAAHRRLPRRQLGGHRRRGRPLHPAPPHHERGVRRGLPRPRRTRPPRLTATPGEPDARHHHAPARRD